MEVTSESLTCRTIPVNPVKQRPGVRTPLRTFTVPKDQYLILGDV